MATPALCRLSGSPLELVLDLGRQPLGNGFLSDLSQASGEYFYRLRCGFSPESALFQIVEQPSPDRMFHGEYAFQSGTSRVMSKHFGDLASRLAESVLSTQPSPFVVEIGSNDGIFLKHMADRGVRHLGVEPSSNVADIAEAQGVAVLREFFGVEAAEGILEGQGPASLIFAANAMCHIPDIVGIARAVDVLLSDEGLLVFEDPYLGDVVRLTSYDQVYDEHVFLFSAMSVQRIFESAGLELIDLEPLRTHGGSMRYTLARCGRYPVSSSVGAILAEEDRLGLHNVDTYHQLARRVEKSAQDLRELIVRLVEAGQEVVAYGATSKSTTVYNYASIGTDLVTAVYDRTPSKQSTYTPGVHIPVLPESQFSDSRANWAFLGAWNHEAEIRAKNDSFEARGGKWITHVPEVRTIE